MSGAPEGRARELLDVLSTSLPALQWETAKRVLAGEDPDLNSELRALLADTRVAVTLPATADGDRTVVAGDTTQPEGGPAYRIGPWQVLRTLGEGGFGMVYLAERADRLFDRQVAIKLMRHTIGGHGSLMARFDAERRILAMLQHPHIAQLIDAGTTRDGQPYFVMEYVDGVPLTAYVATGALQAKEVLRLFLPICDAVEFAHQRLIVHRDLKPGNILVSADGQPKLLDFGIAKLLDADRAALEALTVPGSQPLTPRYASPEQVRGDPVSTSTDVYALGVILYEAIAGQLPYSGTTFESALRAILDHEPAPPTAGREPEIDAIVLTALRKEPRQRYASAGAMAEDIERLLTGQPVKAHGDSRRYRAAKFIRRHRAGVAAAALVLLSLIGGIAATARESRIARAERARAEQREREAIVERQRAEQQAELARVRQQQAEAAQARAQARTGEVRGIARDLLVEFQETVSTLPGGSAAREQLVSRAIGYLNRLERDSSGEPELEADIALGYRKLGDLYEVLYRPGSDNRRRALDAYRQAGKRLEALVARDPRRSEWRAALAAAESGVGSALSRLGRTREAKPAWLRAIGLVAGLRDGESVSIRAASQLELARLQLHETGQSAEPLRLAREAIGWKRSVAAGEPGNAGRWRTLANSEAALAMMVSQSGEGAEALRELDHAQASLGKALALQPGDFLAQRDRIAFRLVRGSIEAGSGRTEQAMATFESAAQAAARLLEIDPQNLNVRYDFGNAHSWLGDMLARMEKPAEAREHYRILADTAEALVKADPASLQWKEMLHAANLRLGDSLLDERRYQESEVPFRAALAVSEQMVAQSAGSAAMLREQAFSTQRLGTAALGSGNLAASLDWQRKAVDLHRRTLGAEPRNAAYLISLTGAWLDLGDTERRIRRESGQGDEVESFRQARQTGEQALALQPKDMEAQEFLAAAAQRLGQRLLERSEWDGALASLERSRELRAQLAVRDPKVARYRRDQAATLSLLGELHAQRQNTEARCRAVALGRQLTADLQKQGMRINNPLLMPERWASLTAGCPAP